MSFFADLERCIYTLTVGTKVYRAGAATVEEGVIVRVTRCTLEPEGAVENPHGTERYYIAAFGSELVGQTFQWRWFVSPEPAREIVAENLKYQIFRLKGEAERAQVIEQCQAALKRLYPR